MLLCPKSKKVELDMSICIHDVNIKNTYLYTYLDQHLNLKSFLKDVIQHVNFKLFLFGKIRHLLTFTSAVLVYKQMVLPFFDYLDILIDGGTKFYIDKMQRLQFRGIYISTV